MPGDRRRSCPMYVPVPYLIVSQRFDLFLSLSLSFFQTSVSMYGYPPRTQEEHDVSRKPPSINYQTSKSLFYPDYLFPKGTHLSTINLYILGHPSNIGPWPRRKIIKRQSRPNIREVSLPSFMSSPPSFSSSIHLFVPYFVHLSIISFSIQTSASRLSNTHKKNLGVMDGSKALWIYLVDPRSILRTLSRGARLT